MAGERCHYGERKPRSPGRNCVRFFTGGATAGCFSRARADFGGSGVADWDASPGCPPPLNTSFTARFLPLGTE